MKSKFKKEITIWLVMTVLLTIFISCTREIPVAPEEEGDGMDALSIDPSFNWSTTKEIDVQVYAKNNSGDPIPYIRLDLMDGDPDNGGKPIMSGATNDQGLLSATITVPSPLDRIYLISNYVGLVSKVELEIFGETVTFTYGDDSPLYKASSETRYSLPKHYLSNDIDYSYLGEWDGNGVPKYLEVIRDVITYDLLDDINTSLPEKQPLINLMI